LTFAMMLSKNPVHEYVLGRKVDTSD